MAEPELASFALSGGLFYVNIVSCSLSLTRPAVGAFRFFSELLCRASRLALFEAAIHVSVRTDNVALVVTHDASRAAPAQYNGNVEWLFSTTFDVMAGQQTQEFSLSVWLSDAADSSAVLLGTYSINIHDVSGAILHERQVSLMAPLTAVESTTGPSPLLRIQTQLTRHQSHVTEEDFEKLRLIGRGSFGKVFQVRKKDTGKVYAMKVLSKGHVIKSNAVKHTMAENRVLKSINHPFIVNLNYAFQTPTHLYMVIDYFNGGELFHHLTQEDYFAEDRARFYAAQVVSALSYLHSRQVIYRDLKPENILLDMEGNVCLVDFGLCKEGMGLENRTFTFCGSPEYLAPELLLGKGYGKEVDWWALGTLIYEMLSGLPPFWDEDEDVMHRKILGSPLKLPQYMSVPVKDLLKGLLSRDPSERLGTGADGSRCIKAHPWFRSVDWTSLEKKELIPPFRPHITSLFDLRYFDETLTQEHPNLSVSASNRPEIDQNAFAGFSYDVDHDPNSSFLRRSKPGTPSSPQTTRRRLRRKLSVSSSDSAGESVATGPSPLPKTRPNHSPVVFPDSDIFPLD